MKANSLVRVCGVTGLVLAGLVAVGQMLRTGEASGLSGAARTGSEVAGSQGANPPQALATPNRPGKEHWSQHVELESPVSSSASEGNYPVSGEVPEGEYRLDDYVQNELPPEHAANGAGDSYGTSAAADVAAETVTNEYNTLLDSAASAAQGAVSELASSVDAAADNALESTAEGAAAAANAAADQMLPQEEPLPSAPDAYDQLPAEEAYPTAEDATDAVEVTEPETRQPAESRAPTLSGSRNAAENGNVQNGSRNSARSETEAFAPSDAAADSNTNEEADTSNSPYEQELASAEPTADTGLQSQEPLGNSEVGKLGPKEWDGPQSSMLSITKFAPGEVQVGAPAEYRIVVRNPATTPVREVRIVDEIPLGARLIQATPSPTSNQGGVLEWSVPQIPAGGGYEIHLKLVATEEGEMGSVARVYTMHQAGMRTKVTRPQLALSVNNPKRVHLGQDITFAVKIVNTGTGVARNITLEEQVPEGLDHPDGRELELAIEHLEPGEVRQFDLTLKAVKPGRVVNQVVAKGAGDLFVQQESEFEVVAPALEVVTAGPKVRYLDTKASFGFTVSNPGTAPAKDVLLTAKLPAGLQFLEANHAGYFDAARNVVTWSLEQLPEQRAGDVKLVCKPIKPGEYKLEVKATAKGDLTATAEHPLRVEGLAALTFSVADLEDPIEVGAETTYEIRVSNPGSKAATNVQISALAPAGMRILEGRGSLPNQVQQDRITFGPLPALNPKSEVTLQVRVQAENPGDLRLRVEISSDDIQPVVKEEPTKVYSAE